MDLRRVRRSGDGVGGAELLVRLIGVVKPLLIGDPFDCDRTFDEGNRLIGGSLEFMDDTLATDPPESPLVVAVDFDDDN